MALHSAIKGKLVSVIGDEVGIQIILFGKQTWIHTYVRTFHGSISLSQAMHLHKNIHNFPVHKTIIHSKRRLQFNQ
jgi:hypothetical protein